MGKKTTTNKQTNKQKWDGIEPYDLMIHDSGDSSIKGLSVLSWDGCCEEQSPGYILPWVADGTCVIRDVRR